MENWSLYASLLDSPARGVWCPSLVDRVYRQRLKAIEAAGRQENEDSSP